MIVYMIAFLVLIFQRNNIVHFGKVFSHCCRVSLGFEESVLT